MKTGIRTRLVAIIALATLAPLAVAILAIQTLGYRHLVKERGTAFQTGAAHVAETIHVLARAEESQLRDLANLEQVRNFTVQANQSLRSLSDADLQAQIQALDERWPRLEPTAPEIAAFLTNALARQLLEFQRRHPLCAEIFCTDRKGRLIASTGKTSDYWQADEGWWVQAMTLRQGRAWLEGLQYDASSATFALDISLPVITAEGQPAGVLKTSLNASPLFSSVLTVLPEREVVRDIVREDGAVLLRLLQPGFVPGSLKVDRRIVRALQSRTAGWMVAPLNGGEKCLAGYAAIKLHSSNALPPLFVVVHEPASHALRPLRLQVTVLTLAGAMLCVLFAAAGVWIAGRKIIGPIERLRSAAGAVAATVHPAGSGPDPAQTQEASNQLSGLSAISTHDELETLAGDFRVMGQRVLSYQQQLEEDIAAKTAAIQRDLDMAREFQTALMPSDYPDVPEGDGPDELSLTFHHIYKPASTVGGDFFDVLKLSQHQAGVFIADVMGHGARSALVTAILRTLLQTYAKQASEPAALLSMVNQQFHELTHRTRQTMFVTAFYMVADTLNRQLTCASAGHPSPLFAQRSAATVQPLFSRLKDNPALGLFPTATYSTWSRPIQPGDLLVLFTDGVLEAVNPYGIEFGSNGLEEVIKRHLADNNDSVINAINNALTRFVGPELFADDVCLVTIDILARNVAPQRNVVGISHPAAVGL